MRPPAPPARSSCPCCPTRRARRRPPPSDKRPQPWLATRWISAANSSDKPYLTRRERGTNRHPQASARNALVPVNARPAGVHSGGCARLFVVEGRKGEKQAPFGFPASSSSHYS